MQILPPGFRDYGCDILIFIAVSNDKHYHMKGIFLCMHARYTSRSCVRSCYIWKSEVPLWFGVTYGMLPFSKTSFITKPLLFIKMQQEWQYYLFTWHTDSIFVDQGVV